MFIVKGETTLARGERGEEKGERGEARGEMARLSRLGRRSPKILKSFFKSNLCGQLRRNSFILHEKQRRNVIKVFLGCLNSK